MLRGYRILIVLLCLLLIGLTVPVAAQEDDPELAWDGHSRFTVLVLGMDRRPGEPFTLSARTDVMIVVSIDPVEERIGMLHIPRDLHLTPVNSDEFIRVNTLMFEGDQIEDDYGPYYAMDTIQYNLGMYIDRFVLFDFEAFIDIVDAIGGIEVTTTYTIDDPIYPDMNFGYDPFYLPAGTHLLDGYDALRFARTRHGDNDFVRGERQMQVIQAIHKKVSEGDTASSLILRAPQLFSALSDNFYSDLTLPDMVQLARYAVTIPSENIYTGSINQEYNMIYTEPGGRNVYIPDREKLAELLIRVFGENYSG